MSLPEPLRITFRGGSMCPYRMLRLEGQGHGATFCAQTPPNPHLHQTGTWEVVGPHRGLVGVSRHLRVGCLSHGWALSRWAGELAIHDLFIAPTHSY